MKALAFLIHDGSIDRVHYALVVAASAAALNQTVTLFFAGRAIHALKAGSPPGWHGLEATKDGRSPTQFDADARGKGVAGVQELIDACRDLGASFVCCEMAARLEGVTAANFREDLSVEIAGAATYVARAGDDGRFLTF